MTNQLEIEQLAALTIPLEVHVFEHGGVYYAFDSRTFAILRLDPIGAAVLSRMSRDPLEKITKDLSTDARDQVIRAHYLRFLSLVQDGTLSIEPLPRPQRPHFYRLVLMLAGGCNMGCTYCFERDVPIYQDPNCLTIEMADKILAWYFRHQEGSKAHVQLYGGEPLLNWQVLMHVVERLDAWAEANNKELTKYLITNGTLLNKDRIAFLRAHKVTIQVSVDGDAETHNRFRVFKSGKPTMDRIKPNIQELISQRADFNLRAVLTRHNKDPEAVISGLRFLGGERVSFEVVATDHPDAQLSEKDWDEFNTNCKHHFQAPRESWSELPDEIKSMIIRISERKRVFYGCGAGVSEVTIAPDGSIYECQRLYRDPYSHICDNKSPTELNSHFLTMVDDRPICNECWARYLCGGGCVHQSSMGFAKEPSDELLPIIGQPSLPHETGSDAPLPAYCAMKYNLAEQSIVKIDEMRQTLIAAATSQAELCTTAD